MLGEFEDAVDCPVIVSVARDVSSDAAVEDVGVDVWVWVIVASLTSSHANEPCE